MLLSWSQQWSYSWTSRSVHTAEQIQEVLHPLLGQSNFGKKITRIVLAWNFIEGKVSVAQALLDPEILDIKMANLAKSSASANANGRRGICENLHPQLNAKVIGQGLEAQGDRGTTTYASELGLAG